MNPEKAPADSFTRFALRVPTEEEVPTVKVSVQLPEGLDEVTFQPKPGWKRTQSGRVVTWSGGEIGVGEFDEFGLSVHLPNTPGETLIFPATQTYANGKVVHWIGALTADEPAPHVTLEAAESAAPATTTTAASETTDDNDDGTDAALWTRDRRSHPGLGGPRVRDHPDAARLRRTLALAAVALTAALLAPGAEAHFGTGKLGYRSTIRGVKPPMRGLKLKVLYGDDQVALDNRSGKTIVIEGYGGEPYLRFAPDGIFVNVNSPAGYLNQDRYGQSTVPKTATAKARPNWQKLAGGNSWAWHDHRIHYMSRTPPQAIQDAPRQPHHVFDWKVPATENGKPFVIAGSLDYKPPPKATKSFPLRLTIVLVILIAVGMVGLLALRRVLLRSLD